MFFSCGAVDSTTSGFGSGLQATEAIHSLLENRATREEIRRPAEDEHQSIDRIAVQKSSH